MPIQVDQTNVTVFVPQSVPADKLHIDDLHIGAAAEVTSPSNAPMAQIVTRLYAEATDGTRTYASGTDSFNTRDLYAVAARIPSIGAALAAVFTGLQDWYTYRKARKADLDAAEATLAQKQQALTDANNLPNDDPTKADKINQAQQDVLAASENVDTARLAWLDPANPPLGA